MRIINLEDLKKKKEEKKRYSSRKRRIKIKNPNRKILKLRCYKCGRFYRIHVNNAVIYTDEVKKKWKCLRCGYN